MSLKSIVSGADCGPVNPLSQMVKHGDVDRSLQRDRAGPSASGSQLRQLPFSSTAGPSSADAALARQFFDGASSSTAPAPAQHVAPFQLPRFGPSPVLQAPPHSPSPQLHDPTQGLNAAWSRLSIQENRPDSSALASAWNNGDGALVSQGPRHIPQAGLVNFSPGIMGGSLGPWGMQGGYMPSMRMHPPAMSTMSGISSGPPVTKQLDWDQEFSRVAGEDLKGKGKEKAAVDAPTGEALEARQDYMGEFEKVWEKMNIGGDVSQSDLAQWEADYQQVLQSQREAGEEFGLEDLDHDYGGDLKRAWESKYGVGLGNDLGVAPTDPTEMDQGFDTRFPYLPGYEFEPNNPHLGLPAASLLAQAKEYLAGNGSLSEAALLVEAAIQKGELGEGGYEAWILLGETRSMDEREDIGLLALREGVRRAKEAGVVGPGMISLAVSYTNESYDAEAHAVLREWLRAKYPSAAVPEPQPQRTAPWHSHDLTVEAYLNIARDLHNQGISDPDVQVGLGILHYADTEYDKAKDCFESALWARPEDYLLWNRLGSCLSNGQKPEEALGVYREALRLRPTYTRAIYNVGVACLNIGAHKEAAEHFLTALSIQKTASGGTPPPDFSIKRSEQLWNTLKKAFLAMEREDLANLTQQGDVEVFKAHGFEF